MAEARNLAIAGGTLIAFLMDWADQKCTDPHDEVYALFELIQEHSS